MTRSDDTAGPGQVTVLLRDAQSGNRAALERLLGMVYDELRGVAQRQLRLERAGHTLDTSALVHEAYLKLIGQPEMDWKSRAHFFGVAARAMRQVLVDYARQRKADKRGGGWARTTLSNARGSFELPLAELLALDDALDRLGHMETRLRDVIELRFFGGMTERETAEVLGVTQRTVQRDWVKARAWLYKELYPDGTDA